MLSLNISGVLAAKGIESPHYFLMKLGISRHTAHLILHNQHSSVQLVHLSKICHALQCAPSDLFIWNDDKDLPITDTHPLSKLRKKDTPPLAGRIRNLSLDQVSILNNFLDDLEKQ